MNTGMLWFDNDPKKSLGDKVSQAAAYYLNKHRQEPNLCFVHPSMLANNTDPATGIQVRSLKNVLPNHFWIGVASESEVENVHSHPR